MTLEKAAAAYMLIYLQSNSKSGQFLKVFTRLPVEYIEILSGTVHFVFCLADI